MMAQMVDFSEDAQQSLPRPVEDQIVEWRLVDESVLYRPEATLVDTKAAVQHLIDTYELEYGRACAELLTQDQYLKEARVEAGDEPREEKRSLRRQ